MKIKFLSSLLFAAIGLSGCRSAATSVNAYYTQVIECLGVEHDGSQTLRSFGIGRNKSDAVEQAKKNAVREVIFKGIRSGMEGCNMRPIITEVNAEEKYEEYFNIFFMDGGEYLKYVSSADEKNWSKENTKASTHISYKVTVRVLRNELKARLKSDNVLK